MQRASLRLLTSVAFALIVAAALYVASSDMLDPGFRTDIVGNPTFWNFNPYDYLWKYVVVVVLLPLLTLAAYVGLTRLVGRRASQGGRLPPPVREIEGIPDVAGWRVWSVTLGRIVFIGIALGLELAISLKASWSVVAAATVVYSAAVLFAGAAARRAGRNPFRIMSVANVLAAPMLILGLYGVSRSTRITIEPTGVEHHYDWLPLWVALIACGALLLFAAVCLARERWRPESFERGVVLLVVAPIVLFLLVADLPGQLGTVDLYEEGQVLAGAELTREGAFPWRDLLVSHGLLHDVGQGLVGFELFEDSRWGLVAGEQVVLLPLAWVGLYYLTAYLLWANWLLLAGAQLLIVTGHVSGVQIRFLLLPFVLLLLVALLHRTTVLRAAAFTTALLTQAILTPEATVAVVAYVGTLAAFEIYYFNRGSGLGAFRGLLYCVATAAGFGVCWMVFLAANHALDDWFFSFAATVPGHALTGAIPILVSRREPEIVATVLLLLGVFTFVVTRTLLRRPLAYRDWAMIAMAGVTLLYFTKFLSRADRHHLEQAFSVTIPLLIYGAYRVITFAESFLSTKAEARGIRWVPRRHVVAVPLLLLLLLIIAPRSLADEIAAAPHHFDETVATEPEVARIGYSSPGENDALALRELERTLDAIVGPGGVIFDFSNAPGLFHYLLDHPPSTRYYHVSYAIRQRTQSDLVRELRKRPPEMVVLTSNGIPTSPSTWDGVANQVRHYDINAWLLDEYVPVRDMGGFVLARRSAGADADRGLYLRVEPCDWGYVPNFFEPEPSGDTSSVDLPIERSSDGTQFVLGLPSDGASYGWLELRTRKPLADGRFELSDRPDGPDARTIAWRTLDRGESTVQIKVGACNQWRGYRPGGRLYLTTTAAQEIDRVRLVR
jgi:hypothetical protein